MGVVVTRGEQDRTVRIEVQGRFDFRVQADFRNAYRKASRPGDRFVVDLRHTEYLDSAALGMLLLLREAAGGDAAEVVIANCRPSLRRILAVAHFERLFTIE